MLVTSLRVFPDIVTDPAWFKVCYELVSDVGWLVLDHAIWQWEVNTPNWNLATVSLMYNHVFASVHPLTGSRLPPVEQFIFLSGSRIVSAAASTRLSSSFSLSPSFALPASVFPSLALLHFKRLFPDLDSIWFVQWKQRQGPGQSTI